MQKNENAKMQKCKNAKMQNTPLPCKPTNKRIHKIVNFKCNTFNFGTAFF